MACVPVWMGAGLELEKFLSEGFWVYYEGALRWRTRRKRLRKEIVEYWSVGLLVGGWGGG